MGLFSNIATVCSICGSNIIGIGAQSIADGKICSNCKAKVSPYLKHIEGMTAPDVFEHIKCREQNRADLEWFEPTRILLAPRSFEDELYGVPIYVDDNNRKFLFSNNNDYRHMNADLFDFSDFRSFTYTEGRMDKRGYIHITVRVYSVPCKSIIEQTYEWSVELPFKYRKKPQDYGPYYEILSEVKLTEAFFNYMASNSSEQFDVPDLTDDVEVNLSCPNCGAVTSASGPTATCEYCGLTFENEYYQESDIEDDVDDYDEDEQYDGAYGDNMYSGAPTNDLGPGISYSSNKIEIPDFNTGSSVTGSGYNAAGGVTPPPLRNVGGSTPPPLRGVNKATPPSLNNAIKKAPVKQTVGNQIKDNVVKGTVNNVGKGAMRMPTNQVGKQAGQHLMKHAGANASKAMAMQAGKQVRRGVAAQAGKQIVGTAGRTVAKQAANAAGRQMVNTAGRAVTKQVMGSAGKAVSKQVAKSAGKAVMGQATKSVGKAVASQASKSVGKAVLKGTLGGLKKML